MVATRHIIYFDYDLLCSLNSDLIKDSRLIFDEQKCDGVHSLQWTVDVLSFHSTTKMFLVNDW